MKYIREEEILGLDEIARQLRIDSIKMIYKRQVRPSGWVALSSGNHLRVILS